MTLETLLQWSESFTDETQTTANALAFANRAIAEINTEARLVLPIILTTTADYTALPESWFIRLILPYLNYGVKMNDSSLAEADRYKMDFDISLAKFKDMASTIVPNFKDENNPTTFKIDASNGIDSGWFEGANSGH